MGEFMSEEKSPESLQFMCTYCDKHRNDAGYWDQVFDSYGSVPESRISHGICPECFQEHFPGEYTSLCKEGRIVVKERIMPDNRVLYGCFFIVSNKGNLYGEYDSEQRL